MGILCILGDRIGLNVASESLGWELWRFEAPSVGFSDNAAYSLAGAGIWAGVISPTLQQWIGMEFRGVSIDFGDLALAVTLMGVMLHGLALVFRDAVAVKAENDEFV